VSLGPMWRATKASWCSRVRRDGLVWLMGIGVRGSRAMPHAGRPSVLLPESLETPLRWRRFVPLRRRLVPIMAAGLSRVSVRGGNRPERLRALRLRQRHRSLLDFGWSGCKSSAWSLFDQQSWSNLTSPSLIFASTSKVQQAPSRFSHREPWTGGL
jgi:hypothetical protein